MIQFEKNYDINDGNGSVTFKKNDEKTVEAVYNRGVIKAACDGETLKGVFNDNVSNGSGLIHFTFNDNGFDAKWKAGIEDGPMKGKWTGKLTDSKEPTLLKKNQIINPLTKETIEVYVEAFEEELDWYLAKTECENIGPGWRLPTRNELFEINKIIGDFELGEDNYWSSTERSPENDSAGRVYLTKDPELLESENKYWLSGKNNSFKVVAVKSISKSNKSSVLGELVIEGKTIEVAGEDLPVLTNFFEAKEGCEMLGEGWRMPTNKELELIKEKLHKIGEFKNEMYWSIVPEDASGQFVYPGHGEGWFFGNDDEGPSFVDEEQDLFNCRPVRDKK